MDIIKYAFFFSFVFIVFDTFSVILKNQKKILVSLDEINESLTLVGKSKCVTRIYKKTP